MSNKRRGNTRKSRAKAVNSSASPASKVVVWIALLAILLLVVMIVIR